MARAQIEAVADIATSIAVNETLGLDAECDTSVGKRRIFVNFPLLISAELS
jgi:hypothetical protein